MKFKLLFLAMVLSPTTALPVIWLHKLPQDITKGKHDFFFPFLKPENIALVRGHTAWAQEILAYFDGKIEQYPASAYTKDIAQTDVQKAQNILKKELRQLKNTLLMRDKRGVHPSVTTCKTPLSPEQRLEMSDLIHKTELELFGEPLKKTKMIGIQGPKLEDFKRRAAIEDAYASLMRTVNRYKKCPELLPKDSVLLDKASTHVDQMYEKVLDTQGLRTAKLMEHV